MPLVVGLDIGTQYVKGAVLAGTASKFRLVDFFTEEIPTLAFAGDEGSEEYVPPPSLAEVIARALEEHNLKLADCVASVESSECVVRQFQVPFTRDEQIRRVVLFTAEEYFPAFSMDEVVLEYLKVKESGGKSQLVVTALRNDKVEARLGLLKSAGVDPLALDLDCAALLNAFALTSAFDTQKSILLLDMGATSTKLVHVEEGRIRRFRSFRTAAAVTSPDRMLAEPAAVGASGGAGASGGGLGAAAGVAPQESLEDRLGQIEDVLERIFSEEPGGEGEMPVAILSDDEFEKFWQESSGGRGEPAGESTETISSGVGTAADSAGGNGASGESSAAGLSPQAYLEKVVAEIQRTFAVSQTSLDLICVTGGLSGREGTCRYLSDELDVDTVRLDFSEGLATDLDPEAVATVSRHGAVAVGLAAKEFGKDLSDLDFRKGPFRYEHRFNRLKFPLLLLAGLGFLFFLQTAYWAYYEYQRLSILEMHYEHDLAAAYKTFFDKELPEGRDALAATKAQKERWEGGGVGKVGKVVDAVDAIQNFSEVMSSTGIFFKIMTMKFDFELRARSSGGKRTIQPVSDSSVELLAEEDRALVTIDQAFKKPVSKYFTAYSASQPSKEGVKITTTLKFKDEILQQFR